MYPNLYFFFKEVLHLEIPILRAINTFGFFVALAFLAAAFVLRKGLRRQEKLGNLSGTTKEVIVGQKASFLEIFLQGVLGFILGYKLLGLLIAASSPYFNPQSFIFSMRGNIYGGLILGGLLAHLRYRDSRKNALPKPEKRQLTILPHQRLGDMTIIAFVGGFVGAKVFHNLENFGEFLRDPIGSLFSLGGLTFYGGLIVAGVAMIVYARMARIDAWILADSFGPALMIAYAVGRLGCQFAGDGDWGILNSAYVSDINGHLMLAQEGQFQQALLNNSGYYTQEFGDLSKVPHAFFNPSWLPVFLKSQNYINNVLGEGFLLPDCEGQYCAFLPVGVFPTPIYEFLLCSLGFWILLRVRRVVRIPGQLFAVYLLLVGVERFFIEKIRVNTLYHIGGLQFTQAELISVILVLAGVIVFLLRKKSKTA